VTSSPLVRTPQQARSRQSFDRALDAAVALLVEHGSASFTLADVASMSGVSTGSIYGRVASKDDLLRAAHAKEMARISAEAVDAFARAPTGATEAQLIRFAVRALAEHLHRNAPIMSPFMVLGIHDEVIAAAGKAAHWEMTNEFERVVLASAPRRSPRRRRAVRWACTVAYSVLARQLALETDPRAAADLDLDYVVNELARMITAYLAADNL
jgi:AcrR family transcriptional regulator